jgi:hypothetical protein
LASGTCPHCITQCAQRSFASGRVNSLLCSYDLMCQSQSLSPAVAFRSLGSPAAWTIRCWSLGPSRRYCREPFLGCLDPYPGSLSGAYTRFFSLSFGLPATVTRSAVWRQPVRRLQYGPFFRGLQSFLYVQASKFVCHPGRSYRRRLRDEAAVTFTSEHRACRCLHARRIC